MPPVVAAVKAVAAWKIGSFAIGQYIIGSVVSYAIGQITAKKPKMPERFEQGLKVNNTSNTYAIPVVYGRRRIGGSEYRAVTGSDNKYLWRIMVVSEGEIEEVEDILLNEKSIDDNYYSGYVSYGKSNRGQQTAADFDLNLHVPNWTDEHIGKNIAYIWARLKFDTDVFPQGLPKLNALVKGKKVYDPRLDTTVAGGSGSHRTSDESTWEWSENPALCILDYLTNTIYGRGVPYEDIDLNSFMVEADYCDETITLRDAAGNDLPNQKRYTCNGVVNPEEESLNVLRDLLASCRGALVSPNDKFRLVIDKPANSVFTFDEDNILGAWTITGAGTRGKKNRIQTRFFDKDNRYDEAITLTTSSGGTDFLAQDNGRILQSDIALNFTNERIRADILAQHLLKQLRLSWKVSFTCNIKGIAVEAMDVIAIKHPAVGWDSGELSNGKLFRVNLVEILDTDTIKITAEEYDSSVYTFDVNTPQASPTTNLPDPESAPAPTSLTLDSSEILVNKDGTIIERIYANWTEPDYAFVHHYEIAYKAGNDSGFTIVATDDDSFYISPVNSANSQFNGQYFVKVRAVYPNGKRSVWYPSSAGQEHEVLGKSAPPSAPTGFVYSQQSDFTRQFDWIPPEDRDIAGYEIRYSSDLTLTWQNMTPLHNGVLVSSPFETSLLSAGTYRFAIKSVDTSGNYSEQAQYITAVLEDNPNVEVLQAYYPRLLGWHRVGKSGTGEELPEAISALIRFNGVGNYVTLKYRGQTSVNDWWLEAGYSENFALYTSDDTYSVYGVDHARWVLARYKASGVDQWRLYAEDFETQEASDMISGSDYWYMNATPNRELPRLGFYTPAAGNSAQQYANVTASSISGADVLFEDFEQPTPSALGGAGQYSFGYDKDAGSYTYKKLDYNQWVYYDKSDFSDVDGDGDLELHPNQDGATHVRSMGILIAPDRFTEGSGKYRMTFKGVGADAGASRFYLMSANGYDASGNNDLILDVTNGGFPTYQPLQGSGTTSITEIDQHVITDTTQDENYAFEFTYTEGDAIALIFSSYATKYGFDNVRLTYSDAVSTYYPALDGGVVNPSSGDLDSVAGNDAEWRDLGTTRWEDWNEWGFASETLIYQTNGFEFGTTLLFRPVIQSTHVGSINHEVAIVPPSVSGDSGFQDSDYGSFFTPAGSIEAKAIKTKTTLTGVNCTLKSLSILLDGKQIEESLFNLDTSTLDSNYRIAAGHIKLPLQKEFTQILSIQVVFIGGGGARSYEVIDKTSTVDGKLAPTVKLYNDAQSLADATIDITVKGF